MSTGLRRTWRLIGADGRPYDSDRPGTLGGHRGSRIYGRLDCRAARAALARGGYVAHRVFFADEQTAIAAGYRPCAVCLRPEYDRWKVARAAEPPGTGEPPAVGAHTGARHCIVSAEDYAGRRRSGCSCTSTEVSRPSPGRPGNGRPGCPSAFRPPSRRRGRGTGAAAER